MKKMPQNRMVAVSPFRHRVYEAVRRIPKGKVTTYKLLASQIGCGSCQAVGQALRGNPFAPEVPCHRVIATDLTIGGFAGMTSGPEIQRKLDLLEAEEVSFINGHLADTGCLFYVVSD